MAAGCGGASDPAATSAGSEREDAAVLLARSTLIMDTHVDVPYRLDEKWADISQRTDDGHFDYPRAKAGGLDAPFMSIYVPASYQTEGGAKDYADSLIDMVEGFVEKWPDKYAIARSPAQVQEIYGRGLIALPMGMENGAPVEGDLANLQHFFDRGVRYITLTHSENNAICDSSYADEKLHQGLSPFGRAVVAEMNRLGIMIDISHVSDDTFWQVIELTEAPLIASHSSARKFTPDFERNMNDEMIKALAENGGVIGINFGSAFLTAAAREYSSNMWSTVGAWVEEAGVEWNSPEGQALRSKFYSENPPVQTTLGDVVDHINHVVSLVGVDHVGFGSDYDGVSSLPLGLEDVSKYPDLIRALQDEGYSDEDIVKMCSGNFMRVWEAVERIAAEG
ncbi:peptidase M19 [Acidobacteria bacterium Mor1]|nr:peptidase M19 [Acidobacteria bacterium Mor1]